MIVHRNNFPDNYKEYEEFLLQTEGDLQCDDCGEDLVVRFRSILDEDGENGIREETIKVHVCENPECDFFHKHR